MCITFVLVLTLTNLEALVFITVTLLRYVKRKTKTKIVTSASRVGRKRVGRRRKRNISVIKRIRTNLWVAVTRSLELMKRI